MLAVSGNGNILDSQAKKVTLSTIIATGGEGSIYNVVEHANLVAKIYHNPISSEKATKLKEMVKLTNLDLLKCTAWPVDILYGLDKSIIGLLMPKISGFKEIHKLYGPKTRLNEFPEASYSFLLHTAFNLARAFGQVHEYGQVIGDVNHGNIMVSKNATVMLIDCDSFQIITNQGKFLCEVGVSTHQPPEFQHLKSFKGVIRTQNHDNFGLAVLIFQLLFLGRHPFSGRYLGKGDMPLEQAIKEFRFAYSKNAKKREIEPPPGTLPLNFVTEPLINLFERAFSPEGVNANGRPTALEWFRTLDVVKKQTVECSIYRNHNYLKSRSKCPWCEFEKKGMVIFRAIYQQQVINNASNFDVEMIWSKINKITPPKSFPSTPVISTISVSPSEKGLKLKSQKQKGIVIGSIFNITLLGTLIYRGMNISYISWLIFVSIIFSIFLYKMVTLPLRGELKTALTSAENRYNSTLASWNNDANDTSFYVKKDELEKAYNTYKNLPSERSKRLQRLQKNIYEIQLISFLQTKRLESASINGIGPNRKAILQSYGIETAADIDRFAIQIIPGFGKVYTERLVNWRLFCQKDFKVDFNKGIPQTELHKLDQEILVLKTGLENKLSAGVQELSAISRNITTKRNNLASQLNETARNLAQAKANLYA